MKIMLDERAFPPVRGHEADAGLDLRSPYAVSIPPGGYCVIDTGVHVGIPAGYCGILKSKSGLSTKENIHTVDGVIDSGYTGSIVAKLHNGNRYRPAFIDAGQKITQLVVVPVVTEEIEIVSSLGDSERGSDGFGSTGMFSGGVWLSSIFAAITAIE